MPKRSDQSFAGAYVITCVPLHKSYVGRSVNINRRWANHRWSLDRGVHRNAPLQAAWREYGPAAFRFEVVERIDGLEGDALEAALALAEAVILARYLDAFNLMAGGEIALRPSDETRAKLSVARKAMWADPAYRARLSESIKRKHADPEYSARRAASIGVAKRKPEARAAVSAANVEKWAPGGVLRETQGAKIRNAWADPEYRARQTASRKAAWVRRKAGTKKPPGIP